MNIKKLILTMALLVLSTTAFAEISLVDVSENTLLPVYYAAKALYYMCWIIGFAIFISGFVQFREYLRNPVQTHLTKPITFWIFGLLLIGIPFIAMLAGVTFSAT